MLPGGDRSCTFAYGDTDTDGLFWVAAGDLDGVAEGTVVEANGCKLTLLRILDGALTILLMCGGWGWSRPGDDCAMLTLLEVDGVDPPFLSRWLYLRARGMSSSSSHGSLPTMCPGTDVIRELCGMASLATGTTAAWYDVEADDPTDADLGVGDVLEPNACNLEEFDPGAIAPTTMIGLDRVWLVVDVLIDELPLRFNSRLVGGGERGSCWGVLSGAMSRRLSRWGGVFGMAPCWLIFSLWCLLLVAKWGIAN